MKNLLNYQTSEYDCGPVSILNGIRYLFEREEIYPDIVKFIMPLLHGHLQRTWRAVQSAALLRRCPLYVKLAESLFRDQKFSDSL